jgi:hypothetical protein
MHVIPKRYGHVVYGVIQSGLTCGVASAISTLGVDGPSHFLAQWLKSWSLSWLFMLPLVLLASPVIRRISQALVRRD